MELTEEMQRAIDLVQSEDKTSLYITGKAGTGKTTLLRHIMCNRDLNAVVVAPTGIAAVNAGGVTIHSLFQMPFGITTAHDAYTSGLSAEKQLILTKLDILIIDEVSMVNASMMDFMDAKLKRFRDNNLPFGGVKVVMFGDLFQLPPVITRDEMRIIKEFYQDVYFFDSNVIMNHGMNVISLSKVFRQNNQEFVDLLNNVREYKATNDDFEWLSEARNMQKSKDFDQNAIHICATRAEAHQINTDKLGQHTHTYYSTTKGHFLGSSNVPAEPVLKLRTGARVMTLCNDSSQNFFNGSLGVVKELHEQYIRVMLDTDEEVTIQKHEWVEYEYAVKDGKIERVERGKYIQFPLALAWAITVHKSQGLTFDNVVLHLDKVFASGQLYVALSRCRSLEGIITDTFINEQHIIPNPTLISFEKSCRENNMYFHKSTYNSKRK